VFITRRLPNLKDVGWYWRRSSGRYSGSVFITQKGLLTIHMVIIYMYIQKHNEQCEVVEKHITRSILQHNRYIYMSRYCFLAIEV